MNLKKAEKIGLLVVGLCIAGIAYAGVIVHGQLVDASLENLSSDPTSHTGRTYFNTTGNHAKLYNSSAWEWLAPNPLTTAGDILYGSSTATPAALSRLAIGGANTVLHGGASAPAYSAVVSADFSGTLSAVKGGTGADLSGATGVLYDAAGSISSIAVDIAWTDYSGSIAFAGCSATTVQTARWMKVSPKSARVQIVHTCTGSAATYTASLPFTAEINGNTMAMMGQVTSSYTGAVLAYFPIITSGDLTHLRVATPVTEQSGILGNSFTTVASTVTIDVMVSL